MRYQLDCTNCPWEYRGNKYQGFSILMTEDGDGEGGPKRQVLGTSRQQFPEVPLGVIVQGDSDESPNWLVIPELRWIAHTRMNHTVYELESEMMGLMEAQLPSGTFTCSARLEPNNAPVCQGGCIWPEAKGYRSLVYPVPEDWEKVGDVQTGWYSLAQPKELTAPQIMERLGYCDLAAWEFFFNNFLPHQ